MPTYEKSDAGNAELFKDLHSKDLRYDTSESPRWLQWRESKSRWVEIDESEMLGLAIQCTKYRLEQARQSQDGKEAHFAVNSGNLPRLKAIISLAQTKYPLNDPSIIWNRDPMLLAVGNGVVDLRSGTFRAINRNDYISYGIDTYYNPNASCPRWLQFLTEITCGNEDLIDFLKRSVGYSMTASTEEQVFFLLHGKGGNGKGVFINILGKVLQKYSAAIRFAALESNSRSDSERDIAELPGTRLVFASEGAEIKVLDTSIIKSITGGDIIRTARKFQHPFSFKPKFKLWLATNHIPKIQDDSDGFWRRIIKIPFLADFNSPEKRDNKLEEKLQNELEGILNWAIEGAVEWNKHGLQTPNFLFKEVLQLRNDSDEFEQMLEICFSRESDLLIAANEAYATYLGWAISTNNSPMTSNAFGRKMGERFKKKRTETGNFYIGVGIR